MRSYRQKSERQSEVFGFFEGEVELEAALLALAPAIVEVEVEESSLVGAAAFLELLEPGVVFLVEAPAEPLQLLRSE